MTMARMKMRTKMRTKMRRNAVQLQKLSTSGQLHNLQRNIRLGTIDGEEKNKAKELSSFILMMIYIL
jgi:hypothetical protein